MERDIHVVYSTSLSWRYACTDAYYYHSFSQQRAGALEPHQGLHRCCELRGTHARTPLCPPASRQDLTRVSTMQQLPWAVLQSGLWGGIVGILLLAIVSNYTIKLLPRCLHEVHTRASTPRPPSHQPVQPACQPRMCLYVARTGRGQVSSFERRSRDQQRQVRRIATATNTSVAGSQRITTTRPLGCWNTRVRHLGQGSRVHWGHLDEPWRM